MQNTIGTAKPKDETSDEDLLEKIKAGEHNAYKVLVDRYLGKLWRLALNVLHNEAEAEDVVQDVLLTVWKNRTEWDSAGTAKFSTWIYRVTLNRCIDQKRRRKTTVDIDVLEETTTSDTAISADKTMMNSQQSKDLLSQLQALPDKQRVAMVCFYYEDLSIKEIADRMQTTEQSIRSLLKRAKKSLREKMGGDPNYEDEDYTQGDARALQHQLEKGGQKTEP